MNRHGRLLYLVFFYLNITGLFLFSQKNTQYKGIQFSSGYSFFFLNTRHLSRFYQEWPLSMFVSYSKSLNTKKENKNFFVAGLRVLNQRFGFHSYYFFPDSLKLYDNSFPVSYRINSFSFLAESGLRFEWNNPERYLFTPFLYAGFNLQSPVFYTLRYDYNGKNQKDNGTAFFRNAWIGPYVNPGLNVLLGVQYNLGRSGKTRFLLDAGGVFFSAPFLIEKNFLPSALYFNYIFLQVQAGILF
jgi:hypothetical protein